MDEQRKQDESDLETLEDWVYWSRMFDASNEVARLLGYLSKAREQRDRTATARILRLLDLTVSQAREVHAAFFGGEKGRRRTGGPQPIPSLYTSVDDDGLTGVSGGQVASPVSLGQFDTETFANQALQQITAAARNVTGLKELDRLADALRTAKEAGEDDIARGLRRTMLEILSPTVGSLMPEADSEASPAGSTVPPSPEEGVV